MPYTDEQKIIITEVADTISTCIFKKGYLEIEKSQQELVTLATIRVIKKIAEIGRKSETV